MNPQILFSFIIWIAYGIWRRRHTVPLQKKMHAMSRRARIIMSIGGLFLSVTILLGGLIALSSSEAIQQGRYHVGAWIAITVIGLIFVHLQTWSSMAVVSLIIESKRTQTPPS